MVHDSGTLTDAITAQLPSLHEHLERTLASELKARMPVAEIVQETYLRAAQNLDGFEFRGEAALFAWLTKIATNFVLEEIRKTKRQVARGGSDTTKWLAHVLVESSSLRPNRVALKRERIAVVEAAIGELEPEQQDLLTMRYVTELRFNEIGRRLGITAAQARGRHRNALKRLQSEIERLARDVRD